MITLSPAHDAARAAAALAATLARLNAGSTGAAVSLYSTTRPASGAAAGGAAMAVFTLIKPAGTITDDVLTLAQPEDALILTTGVALWARVEVNGVFELDGDVTDTLGTGFIKLATTQLYAGGLVHLASGTLS
jgi:hypothetical protein